VSGLVTIARGKAKKGDLTFGTSLRPNNRAPFAKHVLAVTSGKGGVGKSTVAVSLAVGLAQKGLAVGILDADVYGPSVPRLLQVEGERLQWTDPSPGDDGKMIPAENFGVQIVSVGLTTPESDTPLAWRSSVATSALVQLLEDVAWRALDVLVVDMPPGTGDVQITMAQELPLTAAVVVTTPQTVATDDVRRAIRMFKDVNVPVGGVVENMSFFVAPDTGRVYHPFGEGGGRRVAREYDVPFLGELPLDADVRAGGDAGMPVIACGTDAQKATWRGVVDALLAQAPLEGLRESVEAAHVR
jgi:ATP-binding protein involved in chromosome partitioning